jgi:hypothetical protein
MHRFRTFVLIAFACLLALGVCAVVASAGHHAQTSDQKAKSAPMAQTIEKSVTVSTARRSTTYVYTTRTGARYHRHYCVDDHVHYRHTLHWAKTHGYTPCKVCRPPR